MIKGSVYSCVLLELSKCVARRGRIWATILPITEQITSREYRSRPLVGSQIDNFIKS